MHEFNMSAYTCIESMYTQASFCALYGFWTNLCI